MKRTLPFVLIALAINGCSLPNAPEATNPVAERGDSIVEAPADSILTNGRIFTVDESAPWAEAIAISGSDIVYVGDADGAQAYVGDGTVVDDLGGRFVMPGIVSTHEHSIYFMAVSSGLIIKELSHDEDKMLAEVAAYLEQNPDGPFMSFGGGYESTVKIHRDEIDALTGPDRSARCEEQRSKRRSTVQGR